MCDRVCVCDHRATALSPFTPPLSASPRAPLVSLYHSPPLMRLSPGLYLKLSTILPRADSMISQLPPWPDLQHTHFASVI